MIHDTGQLSTVSVLTVSAEDQSGLCVIFRTIQSDKRIPRDSPSREREPDNPKTQIRLEDKEETTLRNLDLIKSDKSTDYIMTSIRMNATILMERLRG